MNPQDYTTRLKNSAASLDTKWPHGADLSGVVYHVYTQTASRGDEAMLILAQVLYLRGGKGCIVLHDIGSDRAHNLCALPSIIVEVAGVEACRHEVRAEADYDIVKLLAAGAVLDPVVARTRLAADLSAKAADEEAAATAADEEAANNEGMRALVLDTMSKDATLSTTAKAFMRGMLLIAPGDLVATAAREMMTEMGDVEAPAIEKLP